MPENAKTKNHPRVSSIWIIPAVAIAIGAWMLVNAALRQDATITIRFPAAQGISENRTKIKARNVEIGTVESLRLSEDFSEVIVTARIDRDASELLREDARFWVVRPQIGTSGIRGVSTLISGVYIELDPGTGQPGKRVFEGLESPPVTASDEKGLRAMLTSDSVGAVQVSDPVLFRGRSVGKVITASFEPETQRFAYEIHIEEPFDQAVSSNTRFWKASALSLEAGTEGFSFNAESLESIIAGGVAFDLPKNTNPGRAVDQGTTFNLYADRDEINRYPYNHYVEYLLLFSDSVRGLFSEASVEYRGIKIGHVVDVSFDYLQREAIIGSEEIPVPALIRIFPGHLDMEDSEESVDLLREIIEKRAANGLRAELRYASFITQSLYVSLDYFSNSEGETIGSLGDYQTFPTQASGIEQIEHQVSVILDKVAALPLEEIATEIQKTSIAASGTLESLQASVDNLNLLLASETTQEIPQSLNATLEQVRATMRGLSAESDLYQRIESAIRKLEGSLDQFEALLRKIENKPSSLLFSKPSRPDPEPRAAD